MMFDPESEYIFTSSISSAPTTPTDYVIRKVLTALMRILVLHMRLDKRKPAAGALQTIFVK